jgi:uncharacterized membrane protein
MMNQKIMKAPKLKIEGGDDNVNDDENKNKPRTVVEKVVKKRGKKNLNRFLCIHFFLVYIFLYFVFLSVCYVPYPPDNKSLIGYHHERDVLGWETYLVYDSDHKINH